jgi:AcrR family transcriptional regulator
VSQLSAVPAPSRRTEQVAARRAELLAAAYQVVLERGLANTRVADVAAATNVSGGLIHYHFATKDDLLIEMLRSAASADIERARAIAAGRGTAIERLDRFLRHYTPGPGGDPAWMLWIDGWGAALREPALRQIMGELDDAWALCLEEVIADGTAKGEFTCPSPAAAARRLSALLDGLGLRVTLDPRAISRREMLEHGRAAAALELGISPSDFTRRTAS